MVSKYRNFIAKYLGLSIVSTLNLGFVFLFQFYAIGILGIGIESDIYMTSIVIPQYMGMVVSVVIVNIGVPYFTSKHGNDLEVVITRGLIAMTVGSILLVVLIVRFSDVILLLLFSEIYQVRPTELSQAFSISCAMVVFNNCSSIWIAYWYSRENYVKVENSTLIGAVIPLALLVFLSDELGVVGILLLSILRFIITLFFLFDFHRLTRKIMSRISKNMPISRGAFSFASNVSITKSEPVIDRALIGSSENAGLVTMHGLAYQMILVLSSIIAKTFGNETLTELSQRSADPVKYKQYFKSSMRRIFILCFLIEACIVLFGEMLLLLILGIFDYEPESIRQIYSFLILLSGVLIGGSLRQVVENLFHSSNRSRYFSLVSLITFGCYFVLKLVAFNTFYIVGLCVAMSAYNIVDPMILYYYHTRFESRLINAKG